jgi:LDH2 family malate/lactate/ureidoglycolate dehydrogenase
MAAADNPEKLILPVRALQNVVSALFIGAGLGESAARRMAQALVEADQQGISSHGVAMVPTYINRLERKAVTTATAPIVVTDSDAIVVLDAKHMLGHLAAEDAMSRAIAKAQAFGIGAASVRHAFHFGVAGRYASQAAQANCIGIALSNSRAMMAAPGGTSAIVGNNPLAIAAPSGGGTPIVLDMAMSEVALARIRAAARNGQAIPSTWAVGPDGAPTTDPNTALAGTLSPAGGVKGFALAVLVDVLCGVLSGGAWGDGVKTIFNPESTDPMDCAFLLIAIDIGHFRGVGDFLTDVESMRERIQTAPRRDGERGSAPGDRRAALEASQGEFVTIDRAVLDQLIKCAMPRNVDTTEMSARP